MPGPQRFPDPALSPRSSPAVQKVAAPKRKAEPRTLHEQCFCQPNGVLHFPRKHCKLLKIKDFTFGCSPRGRIWREARGKETLNGLTNLFLSEHLVTNSARNVTCRNTRAYGRYESRVGKMARTNDCATASAGARLPSSLRVTGTMTRTSDPFVRLVIKASRINNARLKYSLATTRPR